MIVNQQVILSVELYKNIEEKYYELRLNFLIYKNVIQEYII